MSNGNAFAVGFLGAQVLFIAAFRWRWTKRRFWAVTLTWGVAWAATLLFTGG